MSPEELHRSKLKELKYKDEAIDKIVEKYIVNCTYEFAEEYNKLSDSSLKAKILKRIRDLNNHNDSISTIIRDFVNIDNFKMAHEYNLRLKHNKIEIEQLENMLR